jgi:lipopolysaccharide O-acetyltransferase
MNTASAPLRDKLRKHGLVHLVWLAVCKIYTATFYPGCRLIRLPIMVRGRSNISFGRGLVTGFMVRLDAFGQSGCLQFGDRVELNDFVHIGALRSVVIGDDALIASRVFISDHDHGIYSGAGDHSSPDERPRSRVDHVQPVRIGNRVWIGEGASVLAGVTIGDGAVIGAGAVVTRDVPEACLAVGAPARVIRRYDAATGRWLPLAA